MPMTSWSSLSPKDRLIVALDVSDAVAARKLVADLGDAVSFYKVGFQLYVAEGPAMVRELKSLGKKVFLDIKAHEIPNTAAEAVRSAGALGVEMVTVHASGGTKMLQAAAHAAKSCSVSPVVLAVTVLTSMDEADLREVGVAKSPREQVVNLASLAKAAGCTGIVCSPEEAGELRLLGPELAIVTPGVRPLGAEKGDQSRVATPAEAIRAGASHIVVGRPISRATDPRKAAEAIVAEIAGAFA
jgi:orotidine-5'-phosphate decarboxylase